MTHYREEEKTTALILRRTKKEFQLLVFKSADCENAPFRMPDGGGYDGENPWQGVYREIKEETGIDRTDLVFLREIGRLEYYKPLIHKKVNMHHYLFLLNTNCADTFSHIVKKTVRIPVSYGIMSG